MESEAQWLQEVVESEDAGEQKAGWSNGAGPLAALLRLLKLQEKGRQRPPPSHLRASGLAIPHALHYCTALLTMGLLRPAPLAIIDARGVHPGVPGFTFSAKFRRNFGENFVSASSREVKFRYFSPFSVLKFKNSKIFIKNSEKI